MDEIIAIVNDKDEIIGTDFFKHIHSFGLLHREAYIYLINSNNEVLLQRRNDNNLWDHSAAGHFSEKESYVEGAKRELFEELGIDVELNDLKEIVYEKRESIKPNKKNLRFVKIYLLRKKVLVKDMILDPNEVKEVKYFNKDDLKKLLETPQTLANSAKEIIQKHILNLI
ncbi:MAG: NUDIX domain-containing protein [Candidatus Nanoarchaeia archaeon]|nr:NUDIX domain-containing protein [Candidatus Nanoarchaeia archaeon]